MAGKRKGVNRQIYELLVRFPHLSRTTVLNKLTLGDEHSVTVYRIRSEIKKQQQREIDMQVKEAVEEADKRKSEKMAKKLRQAIEEGDADAVRSHIDFLINRLDSGEASKDTLQKVFTLFQEDLVHMRQAYDMLSRHHDTCLLQIADLQRQTDVAFGWKYLWKWLMYHIRPRKNTGW